MNRVETCNSICSKLPRKFKNVFQAWYWAHNGSEMICIQQRIAEPKYFNITNVPTQELESRVEKFLEE